MLKAICLGLIVVTIALAWRYMALPPITRQEAAEVINRMLNGTVQSSECDDFLFVEAREDADPTVRSVARECAEVYEKYPAGPSGGYCSAAGFAQLAELRDILRSGIDYR